MMFPESAECYRAREQHWRKLEAEGISFKGGRADPSRHLTWLDLAARSESHARLRS